MSTVYSKQFYAAIICVINIAIGNADVFKGSHGFGAHLDGALSTLQLHAPYFDIAAVHFARSSFKTKCVISTGNVTVADAHVLASIDVNSIIVGNAATDDLYVFNMDIRTLKIM